MGNKISNVGKGMTAAITLPVIAAGAALGAMAVNAGKWADELLTMSAQTGIAVGTLQELQYASELVDVDIEVMTKGLAKVTKQIGAAAEKGGDFIEISDGINVSIRDTNGQLRRSEDVFYDTIDAIGKLENETEKEIASQTLFGKSYQDLMPLIKAGTGALKKYADEAKRLGLILSQEDVEALGKFDDSMVKLRATLATAGAKLSVALLPALEKLMPVIEEKLIPAVVKLGDKIAGLITWFLELPPGMQETILKFIGLAVVAGPLLVATGKVIEAFGILGATFIRVTGYAKAFTGTAGTVKAVLSTISTAGAVSEISALGLAFLTAAGYIGVFAAAIYGAIEWTKRFVPELAELRSTIPGITLAEQYEGATPAGVVNAPSVENYDESFKPKWDMRWIESKIYGRKADGGGINRTGAYLVGEEGPEVVNLNAGDYVTPNDEWAGLRPIHRREKFIGEGEAEGAYKRGEGIFKGFEAWLREGLMNQEMMGFASGGIVPGPLGAPSMAIVHGGEEVLTPAQRGGGSQTLTVTGTVRVEGVNNKGELVATTRILADDFRRMAARPRLGVV